MANDIKPAPKAHLWQKGQSGNPNGRPLGSKNKITLIRQALEGELMIQLGPAMAEVMSKAIELAKGGSESMIKLLVDKTLTSRKADDNEDASPKVQIMIGKMPDRKEDIVINGKESK